VGTPLNDTQVLTGVFKPTTELVMKVIGDKLSVEAHNSADAATLALEGIITPNAFGGAGADWYGTVSRGNSNVYSRFEISYPGLESTCATAPEPGVGPMSGPMPGRSATSSGSASTPAATSSRGCALRSPLRSQRWALSTLFLAGLLTARLSQGRRGQRG
jgi:hypothetical protein